MVQSPSSLLLWRWAGRYGPLCLDDYFSPSKHVGEREGEKIHNGPGGGAGNIPAAIFLSMTSEGHN